MNATLTSKGQLTIPKAIRDRLGLKPGDRVDFSQTGEGVVELRRVQSPTLDDIVGAFAHLADGAPETPEERRAAIGDALLAEDECIRREGRG